MGHQIATNLPKLQSPALALRAAQPEGVPDSLSTLSGTSSFWHPFGVQTALPRGPGVSLRSTPGYYLASLRLAGGATRGGVAR